MPYWHWHGWLAVAKQGSRGEAFARSGTLQGAAFHCGTHQISHVTWSPVRFLNHEHNGELILDNGRFPRAPHAYTTLAQLRAVKSVHFSFSYSKNYKSFNFMTTLAIFSFSFCATFALSTTTDPDGYYIRTARQPKTRPGRVNVFTVFNWWRHKLLYQHCTPFLI